MLGTIEYRLDRDNLIVWSTCSDDIPTVVQLGTASSEWALKAALHMYQDYTAIDVNMGCPEKFSVKGGMGAALLVDRERIKDIVSTLVRNIDKPVTCKIRLLPELSDTIDLVKTIESLGVQAIAVHGRYVPQRSNTPPHHDLLKTLSSAVSIPMIANGDIYSYDDIQKVKDESGCSSVMIGRGALINCSIFQPQLIPQVDICKEYLENCIKYDNVFSFSKYTALRMFGEVGLLTKTPFYEGMVKSKTHEGLLECFKLLE